MFYKRLSLKGLNNFLKSPGYYCMAGIEADIYKARPVIPSPTFLLPPHQVWLPQTLCLFSGGNLVPWLRVCLRRQSSPDQVRALTLINLSGSVFIFCTGMNNLISSSMRGEDGVHIWQRPQLQCLLTLGVPSLLTPHPLLSTVVLCLSIMKC